MRWSTGHLPPLRVVGFPQAGTLDDGCMTVRGDVTNALSLTRTTRVITGVVRPHGERGRLMNLAKRIMIRTAGVALVLTGVALVAAGPASANDRSVSVLCTDKTSGAWRVSVTFS